MWPEPVSHLMLSPSWPLPVSAVKSVSGRSRQGPSSQHIVVAAVRIRSHQNIRPAYIFRIPYRSRACSIFSDPTVDGSHISTYEMENGPRHRGSHRIFGDMV